MSEWRGAGVCVSGEGCDLVSCHSASTNQLTVKFIHLVVDLFLYPSPAPACSSWARNSVICQQGGEMMARWMSTINENVSGLGCRNGYCKYSNLPDCPHEISAGGSCVLRKLNVFTRQTGDAAAQYNPLFIIPSLASFIIKVGCFSKFYRHYITLALKITMYTLT